MIILKMPKFQVLATMFISVSQNLPKTSYIKMVDVWLIFNLMIPFFWGSDNFVYPELQLSLQVILHTYIDSMRSDDNREVNHHGAPRVVGGRYQGGKY